MERRGEEGLEKGRDQRERELQYTNHHNRFRVARYIYPNRRIAIIHSKLADLNQSAVTFLRRNSRHLKATMQVTGEHRGACNPGAGPRWLAEARRGSAFWHCKSAAATPELHQRRSGGFWRGVPRILNNGVLSSMIRLGQVILPQCKC